jgi:hypothetical protein
MPISTPVEDVSRDILGAPRFSGSVETLGR